MTETRGFRVGFVTTLWGAIGVMVVVTAWALWPTFVEWWSVRSLIENLKAAAIDRDFDRRLVIRKQLDELGSIAVPALVELMKDSNLDARFAAIQTLENMTDDDDVKPAIPAIIEALQDEESRVRTVACWALTAHREIARAAIPALRERLRDPDERDNVLRAAFYALKVLDGVNSEMVQFLRDLAQTNKYGLRDWAERRFGELDAHQADEAAARTPAGDE